MAETWETRPGLDLSLIDRMRLVADTESPLVHRAERQTERARVTAEIRQSLAADLCLLFEDEIRAVAEGRLAHVRDLVTTRKRYYDWLLTLEPPFIVNGPLPPNTSWARRADHVVPPAAAGATLRGVGGCPGTATGRARVVLDPTDPLALEPGDVLVAPIMDPAWTPLFVPATAVVVDVGAPLSHAIIVSRELGIPCVVSVKDATQRIPDGATVRVDGDSGTVTVVALP